MNAEQPPARATWLFERLGSAATREVVAGDLIEQFQKGALGFLVLATSARGHRHWSRPRHSRLQAVRGPGARDWMASSTLHKTVPTSPNIARLMSGNDNGPIPMNASWKRCSEYSLPVFAR